MWQELKNKQNATGFVSLGINKQKGNGRERIFIGRFAKYPYFSDSLKKNARFHFDYTYLGEGL